MNNKYIITISHPILRPGLVIETEASEKYLPIVTGKLLEKAREINGLPIIQDKANDPK